MRIPLMPMLLLFCGSAFAQMRATDIAYIRLSVDGDDVELSEPIRLTNRPSYDNQPQFLPDGTLVYTTSIGETTDIVHYSRATRRSETLVAFVESEYSPTPIPGQSAISFVRDYGNRKQQLWSFPLNDHQPRLLLPDINPVGYHAWVDETRLLLFVLGEPPTLQLATVGPGEGRVLAENPGRALARIPGSHLMSFVHKLSEGDWWLCGIDVESGEISRFVEMPEGREDFAWAPDRWVWTGDGSRLLRFHPQRDREWLEVADLEEAGITGITRLAFHPEGSAMALVLDR